MIDAALAFLKAFWKPIAGALALLLALWALHHYGQSRYEAGEDAKQAEWDEANRVAQAAADKKEADDRQAITAKTEPIKEARDETLKKIELDRAAVAAGTKRVYVRAACPSSNLPSSPTAPSVDDGKAAELAPADGETVLLLKEQLTKTEAALAGLQEWARVVSPSN